MGCGCNTGYKTGCNTNSCSTNSCNTNSCNTGCREQIAIDPWDIKCLYEMNCNTNAFTDEEKALIQRLLGDGEHPLQSIEDIQIKLAYERNPNTNAFTDAEKEKLAHLILGSNGYTKDEIDALLLNKVDKESGKGLSSNDFTDLLKHKLETISSGNDGAVGPQGPQGDKGDKGDASTVAGPTGIQGVQGVQGDKGDTGTGVTIKGSDTLANIQAKDGSAGDLWIDSATGHGHVSDGGGSGASHWTDVGPIKGDKGDTGIQGPKGDDGAIGPQGDTGSIDATDKAKLDHITVTTDVNLTDMKNTQASELLRTQGISYVPTNGNVPEHIATALPIVMEGTQTIPTDHTVAKASKELITIGNFAKQLEMFKDTLGILPKVVFTGFLPDYVTTPDTILNFTPLLQTDTNDYSGGVFTAPSDGLYRVEVSLLFVSTKTSQFNVDFMKNIVISITCTTKV